MDQSSSAAPHSFSQLGTSFIASESLGIPHTPLVTLSSVSHDTYLFALSLLHDVKEL
jgi:hypothetical protein